MALGSPEPDRLSPAVDDLWTAGQVADGANENVGGTWSKTGGCPDGNLYLHEWGVQSYQYVRASGGGCKCRREWDTHVFGSNDG